MALYFMSYDLRADKDYDKLYEEMRRFNAVRMLDSHWCFNRTNTNARNLRDHFKQFIDADDGLTICRVDNRQWAGYKMEGTPNNL